MRTRISLATAPVINVPHEQFDDRHILAVEEAVRLAWKRLCATAGITVLCYEADEASINNGMRNLLDQIRGDHSVPGYDCATFTEPVKGGEFEDFNGAHLEQSPDLAIKLFAWRPGVSLNIYDAIFVECKIVGPQDGIGEYGTEGIARFVDGRYGWAMPHGMMIAYVCNGLQLPDALDAYFARSSGGNARRYGITSRPMVKTCDMSKTQPLVYITTHARTWSHRNASSPGDIELRHLWLSAI